MTRMNGCSAFMGSHMPYFFSRHSLSALGLHGRLSEHHFLWPVLLLATHADPRRERPGGSFGEVSLGEHPRVESYAGPHQMLRYRAGSHICSVPLLSPAASKMRPSAPLNRARVSTTLSPCTRVLLVSLHRAHRSGCG